jgi:hypothetical protein
MVMSNPMITLNGKPAEIYENYIVDSEGYEISWQELFTGDVECLPEERPVPLVVICTENGYGPREMGTRLIGNDIVVRYDHYEDIWNVGVEAGVTDPIATALDAAADDLRAVAVGILGPLLDDDPDVVAPEFQHTPYMTDDMGGNAVDDPMLDWVYAVVVDPRVAGLFRQRLAAGAYPEITKMQTVGSVPWRQWVRSLLTAVPLASVHARNSDPLYVEEEILHMSDNELIAATRRAFRRPGN